jgi:hypothetical protein
MKKSILLLSGMLVSFPVYSKPSFRSPDSQLCVEVSTDDAFKKFQSENQTTATVEVQFHLSKKEGRRLVWEDDDRFVILPVETSKKTCVKTGAKKKKLKDGTLNVRATLNVKKADGRGYGRKCNMPLGGNEDNEYMSKALAKKQSLLITLSTLKKRESFGDSESGAIIEDCSIKFHRK